MATLFQPQHQPLPNASDWGRHAAQASRRHRQWTTRPPVDMAVWPPSLAMAMVVELIRNDQPKNTSADKVEAVLSATHLAQHDLLMTGVAHAVLASPTTSASGAGLLALMRHMSLSCCGVFAHMLMDVVLDRDKTIHDIDMINNVLRQIASRLAANAPHLLPPLLIRASKRRSAAVLPSGTLDVTWVWALQRHTAAFDADIWVVAWRHAGLADRVLLSRNLWLSCPHHHANPTSHVAQMVVALTNAYPLWMLVGVDPAPLSMASNKPLLFLASSAFATYRRTENNIALGFLADQCTPAAVVRMASRRRFFALPPTSALLVRASAIRLEYALRRSAGAVCSTQARRM